MFSPLRNRFGIPGAISVIALVFAMLGGAYAASDSGSGDSRASASAVKKGPRGPRGPRGPAGPAGAQGPAGPQGAKGDTGVAGANGKDGTNGTNGTNGTSATTATFAGAKGSCTEGGVEVKSSSPTALVCNGAKGADGTDGSPWTAGGTLPSGATETGVWALDENSPTLGLVHATSISFPVPLAAPLGPAKVHVIGEGKTVPEACENPSHAGEASVENPEAKPGELCVFVSFEGEGGPHTIEVSTPGLSVLVTGEQGAGTAGALVTTLANVELGGTFAVTGAS